MTEADATSSIGTTELTTAIEATLLKAEATASDVAKLCREALEHRVAGVCVHPSRVSQVVEALKDSEVRTVSVVGFPFGSQSTATKIAEIRELVRAGVDEIDGVIQLGALKDQRYEVVLDDLMAMSEARGQTPLKIIIEAAALNDTELCIASALVQASGAEFVKTSTGFGPGGADVEQVARMREVLHDSIQIKASGGIKDRASAIALMQAGATRLGTSSATALLAES